RVASVSAARPNVTDLDPLGCAWQSSSSRVAHPHRGLRSGRIALRSCRGPGGERVRTSMLVNMRNVLGQIPAEACGRGAIAEFLDNASGRARAANSDPGRTQGRDEAT